GFRRRGCRADTLPRALPLLRRAEAPVIFRTISIVTSAATIRASNAPTKVLRHALADRVFHWLTAASVLTLLGTAFLPILGFKFDWVTAHWIAGLVLIGAVLFHLVRSLVWQNWRTVMIYGA